MRAGRVFAAVDSHTEGMPTRVITGGVGPIPGASMLERKLHFEAHMDELRLLLMREPRGHGAMSGAILQPPLRDDADWGVVFIEVSGCLPMCGHGTIGVATVLVETGMVEVSEPETLVRLDTPAGLVEARVTVEGGRAASVSLRNVPSFLLARDRSVAVNGGSQHHRAHAAADPRTTSIASASRAQLAGSTPRRRRMRAVRARSIAAHCRRSSGSTRSNQNPGSTLQAANTQHSPGPRPVSHCLASALGVIVPSTGARAASRSACSRTATHSWT